MREHLGDIGGAKHAETSDLLWVGAACADLRDHGVRLMERRGRHCLRRVATAKAMAATAINLTIGLGAYSRKSIVHTPCEAGALRLSVTVCSGDLVITKVSSL